MCVYISRSIEIQIFVPGQQLIHKTMSAKRRVLIAWLHRQHSWHSDTHTYILAHPSLHCPIPKQCVRRTIKSIKQKGAHKRKWLIDQLCFTVQELLFLYCRNYAIHLRAQIYHKALTCVNFPFVHSTKYCFFLSECPCMISKSKYRYIICFICF